jgi:hypothetical protein
MIATLLMVALLPSGTYHYDWSIGGHSVGSSTILVRRSGGTLDVGESGSLPGRTINSERKIREATFANLSYVADAGGKHIVLTFSGNDATLTADGQNTTIAAPAGAPFLVNDNMTAGFALMPATLASDGREAVDLGLPLRRVRRGARDGYRPADATAAGRCAWRGRPLGRGIEGQTATLWFHRQERTCSTASSCPRKT